MKFGAADRVATARKRTLASSDKVQAADCLQALQAAAVVAAEDGKAHVHCDRWDQHTTAVQSHCRNRSARDRPTEMTHLSTMSECYRFLPSSCQRCRPVGGCQTSASAGFCRTTPIGLLLGAVDMVARSAFALLCALSVLAAPDLAAATAGSLTCSSNAATHVYYRCEADASVTVGANLTYTFAVDTTSATNQLYDVNLTLTPSTGDADL